MHIRTPLAIALAAASALALVTPAGSQTEEPMLDPEQKALIEPGGDVADAPALIPASSVPTAELSPDQSDQLDILQADPTTASVRVVDLDVSALDASSVRLAPSGELDTTARQTQRTELEGGGFVWVGELQEVRGEAVLVVKDGRVTGNIRSDGRLYQISPLGSLHAIREVDVTKFPEEHPPEYEAIERESGALDLPPEDTLADPDQQRQVDVLVAYTPAADSKVADIDALIALAVAENNLANRNSAVNILIDAVTVHRVSYTESGSFGTDLARFRNLGDGHMDEIHEIRDQHGADMAVLIIDNGSYCGLASTILANEATAFAAVHYSCATGYYSFAHELGHLQGARHNPEVDSSTSPFAYGHGMIRPTRNDRTVMAYNCAGGCTRKPYWSGPNVIEGGAAFGDATSRDNARALNQTATRISNFRSPPRPGGTAYTWAHSPTTGTYTPSGTYTHNSAGGDVSIRRLGTGYYRVTFEGLGGKGTAGGHVQVSAYGSSNHHCKSGGWWSGGDDFVAYVRCYAPNGARSDTRYNVFVRWP